MSNDFNYLSSINYFAISNLVPLNYTNCLSTNIDKPILKGHHQDFKLLTSLAKRKLCQYQKGVPSLLFSLLEIVFSDAFIRKILETFLDYKLLDNILAISDQFDSQQSLFFFFIWFLFPSFLDLHKEYPFILSYFAFLPTDNIYYLTYSI